MTSVLGDRNEIKEKVDQMQIFSRINNIEKKFILKLEDLEKS